MTLLAHVSDPHLGPLPAVRFRDLMSKRVIGWYNWRANRSNSFAERILATLLDDLRRAKPDHIAVTGDLVNIGLEAEHEAALAWLHTLGDPHDVTVIPGNHDAYVARAIEHYSSRWLPFANGDKPSPALAFPFVRRRENIALIGCSTAVATPPFMATGLVKADQAEALGKALHENRDACRIVLIHHSPAPHATTWTRRLIGSSRVRDAIAKNGAELVLHGHNHKLSLAWIEGADGPVPVVGAAALSEGPSHGHRGGSYNLIRIEGEARPYKLALTGRGLSDDGNVDTVFESALDQPTAIQA
jgi:3',5'-cyclic AMP phosphodiesterase CpdA